MKDKIDVFLKAYDDVEKSFTKKDFDNYWKNNSNKKVQLVIYFVVIGGYMNNTVGLNNYIKEQNS